MKKTSKAERIRTERTRNIEKNRKDYKNGYNQGGNGNAFELEVLEYLVPRSTRTQVQQKDRHDLRIMLQGRYRTFEVKTGAGEIVKLEDEKLYDLKVNQYNLQTLLDGQKSEAIIYSYDGNINNARVFTKEEFFNFLRTYPSRTGNKNGMFQKMGGVEKAKEKGYLRLKIAVNNSNCKAKRDWLLANIDQVGISLQDLKVARA